MELCIVCKINFTLVCVTAVYSGYCVNATVVTDINEFDIETV